MTLGRAEARRLTLYGFVLLVALVCLFPYLIMLVSTLKPTSEINRPQEWLPRDVQWHNLIDVYELLVFPVLLGEGKRLFETGIDHSMRLAESRATDSGLVVLTYEPAGELTFGSVDDPRSS